jgi:hypothetical protein
MHKIALTSIIMPFTVRPHFALLLTNTEILLVCECGQDDTS